MSKMISETYPQPDPSYARKERRFGATGPKVRQARVSFSLGAAIIIFPFAVLWMLVVIAQSVAEMRP